LGIVVDDDVRNQKVVRGHLHKDSAQPLCPLPIRAHSILDKLIVAVYLFGAALIDNYNSDVVICVLLLPDSPLKILQRYFAFILIEENIVFKVRTLLFKSGYKVFNGMKSDIVGSILPLAIFARCNTI
jgi:predicted nucleotidyltransferase